MSSAPLVSVIIIFRNAEKFIEEAIDSVFAQTYNNWELLLVDDGSTDSGTRLALYHTQLHPEKIRYLEHKGHINRGTGASRDLGISRARGKFVAFLDADDVWFPEKLTKQVAFMEKNPDIGLLFHPAFDWKGSIKTPQLIHLPPGKLPRGAWVLSLLDEGKPAGALPSTVLMRTSVAINVGGFEQSIRRLYEDQVMWIKISLNTPIFYDSSECLALYRIHPDSLCRSTLPDRYLLERIRFYEWIVAYLKASTDCQLPLRLPTLMAQCNLFKALLQFLNQSTTAPFDRFRKSTELVHTHVPSPSRVFTAMLQLGALIGPTAITWSDEIFAFARVTHTEGLGKALKIIPRWLIERIRPILPKPVERSMRRLKHAIQHIPIDNH